MSLELSGNVAFWRLGAAGVILSSSATSQVLPSMLSPSVTGPLPPLQPAQPLVPAAPAGIDPTLFAKAKAALDTHKVWPRDSIGIVDFSQPSADPRFFVVDLMSGNVESHRVAHGRGSDPDHSGFVERFSNDFTPSRAPTAPTSPAIITRANTGFR